MQPNIFNRVKASALETLLMIGLTFAVHGQIYTTLSTGTNVYPSYSITNQVTAPYNTTVIADVTPPAIRASEIAGTNQYMTAWGNTSNVVYYLWSIATNNDTATRSNFFSSTCVSNKIRLSHDSNDVWLFLPPPPYGYQSNCLVRQIDGCLMTNVFYYAKATNMPDSWIPWNSTNTAWNIPPSGSAIGTLPMLRYTAGTTNINTFLSGTNTVTTNSIVDLGAFKKTVYLYLYAGATTNYGTNLPDIYNLWQSWDGSPDNVRWFTGIASNGVTLNGETPQAAVKSLDASPYRYLRIGAMWYPGTNTAFWTNGLTY